MLLRDRTLPGLLAPLLVSISLMADRASAEQPAPQYLIFQIFIGTAEPASGVYHSGMSKPEIQAIARHIADTLRPERNNPNRILGFAIGPIAMDQGEDDARRVIRDAFDVALETDMAVALHLDDYMFWAQASGTDGRQLRAAQDTAEWTDWSGTPAGGLDIGWLPNVRLAPQLCYESPQVMDFVGHWTRDVIGQEIKQQFDRLVEAGKGQLFAGIIAGWESNLSDSYCSFSYLGYSAEKPPDDFDHERERVLQRHIERWAKGIFDSGIPRQLIFTHLAPLPRRDYEKISAMLPRERIRKMPQSTAFGAYWTAFNNYSNPGFSAYVDEGRFEDIYEAIGAHASTASPARWAMAEGTNVVLAPGGPAQSPLDWETYLARSFNHGAAIVNLFGGFQGPRLDPFRRATDSQEALSAYRKFLQGDSLVEQTKP